MPLREIFSEPIVENGVIGDILLEPEEIAKSGKASFAFWDESKHPRDHGRFAPKGQGESSTAVKDKPADDKPADGGRSVADHTSRIDRFLASMRRPAAQKTEVPSWTDSFPQSNHETTEFEISDPVIPMITQWTGKKVSKENLANLAGSPDGVRMEISDYGPNGIHIESNYPDGTYSRRTLHKTSNGLVMRNLEYYVPKDKQSGGNATRMLASQVSEARRLGVRAITAYAAGHSQDPTEEYTGYKVWPKFGYDGEIPEGAAIRIQRKYGDRFNEASTIQDLYAMPGGREVWESLGESFDATLDLTPGSRSMKIFDAYMEKKAAASKQRELEPVAAIFSRQLEAEANDELAGKPTDVGSKTKSSKRKQDVIYPEEPYLSEEEERILEELWQEIERDTAGSNGRKAAEFDWDESQHPRGRGGKFSTKGTMTTGTIDQPDIVDDPQEYQVLGVRSQAFKNWFGDWESGQDASKVVDKNGEPQVVHHGSGQSFDSFDPGKLANSEELLYGPGFYFTSDEGIAGEYSRNSLSAWKLSRELTDEDMGRLKKWFDSEDHWWAWQDPDNHDQMRGEMDAWSKGKEYMERYLRIPNGSGLRKILGIERIPSGEGKIFNVYLNIRRPFDMESPIGNELWESFGKPAGTSPRMRGSDFYEELTDFFSTKYTKDSFRKKLESLGYDGITHTGGKITGGRPHKVWIAFKPEQIKAVDNKGTFDPLSPKIREAAFDWDESLHPRDHGKFAPKGTVTTKTNEQPDIVDDLNDYQKAGAKSQSFKNWFGDWESGQEASKVVDGEGKPLVVHHGTSFGSFDAFSPGKTTNQEGLLYGPGFYFTEDKGIAEEYTVARPEGWDLDREISKKDMAKLKRWYNSNEVYQLAMEDIGIRAELKTGWKALNAGPEALKNYLLTDSAERQRRKVGINRVPSKDRHVFDVYLNIRKPFDLEKPIGKDVWESFGKPAGTTPNMNGEEFYVTMAPEGKKKEFADKLQSIGYDGITHLGGKIMGKRSHRVWIAFKPEQIKAVDNKGTFDPMSPKIREAEFSRYCLSVPFSSDDWDEDKHPRDKGGRFSPKGHSDSGNNKTPYPKKDWPDGIADESGNSPKTPNGMPALKQHNEWEQFVRDVTGRRIRNEFKEFSDRAWKALLHDEEDEKSGLYPDEDGVMEAYESFINKTQNHIEKYVDMALVHLHDRYQDWTDKSEMDFTPLLDRAKELIERIDESADAIRMHLNEFNESQTEEEQDILQDDLSAYLLELEDTLSDFSNTMADTISDIRTESDSAIEDVEEGWSKTAHEEAEEAESEDDVAKRNINLARNGIPYRLTWDDTYGADVHWFEDIADWPGKDQEGEFKFCLFASDTDPTDDEESEWEKQDNGSLRHKKTGEEFVGDQPDLYPEDDAEFAIDWDESLHPRDHGKFAPKGQGESALANDAGKTERHSGTGEIAGAAGGDWKRITTKTGRTAWEHPESGHRFYQPDKPTQSTEDFTKRRIARESSPPKVSYYPSTGNLIKEAFGDAISPDEAHKLIGAPNGSKVELTSFSTSAGDVQIAISARSHQVMDMSRRLSIKPDGTVVMKNDMFFLKKNHRGNGLGTDIFSNQVRSLANLGVDRIYTVGGRSRSMNGYYTWPRLGYDARLPSQFKATLPENLKGAETIQDLYQTKEGIDYWRKNGLMMEMSFDLSPGSKSIAVLNEYLKKNGKEPIQVDEESSQKIREERKKRLSKKEESGLGEWKSKAGREGIDANELQSEVDNVSRMIDSMETRLGLVPGIHSMRNRVHEIALNRLVAYRSMRDTKKNLTRDIQKKGMDPRDLEERAQRIYLSQRPTSAEEEINTWPRIENSFRQAYREMMSEYDKDNKEEVVYEDVSSRWRNEAKQYEYIDESQLHQDARKFYQQISEHSNADIRDRLNRAYRYAWSRQESKKNLESMKSSMESTAKERGIDPQKIHDRAKEFHEDYWKDRNARPEAYRLSTDDPNEIMAHAYRMAIDELLPRNATFSDWDETKHPRGQGGRFTSAGSGWQMTKEQFVNQPLVRTIGEDFSDTVLHGTTKRSAQAFLSGTDLPVSERNRTLSEWGDNVIYTSEHDAPHQALMFSSGKSQGQGGARTLLEFRLRPGSKVLDISPEATRRPFFDNPSGIHAPYRPTWTDDMAKWLNESRERRGLPPLANETALAKLDPASPRFAAEEYLSLLASYARDRGYAAVRTADETVIVDRSAIIGGREVKPAERQQIKERPRKRQPMNNASLYTKNPDFGEKERVHKEIVARAIEEGKMVHDSVLADYPELAAKKSKIIADRSTVRPWSITANELDQHIRSTPNCFAPGPRLNTFGNPVKDRQQVGRPPDKMVASTLARRLPGKDMADPFANLPDKDNPDVRSSLSILTGPEIDLYLRCRSFGLDHDDALRYCRRESIPRDVHKLLVKRAIDAGERIPKKVLAEYPDLDPRWQDKVRQMPWLSLYETETIDG